MSSHHIVREKQEPALVILGLDNFADELLGQLLEWSPVLITTPLIAENLNSRGIKIDWIISDEIDDGLQSDIKYLPVEGKSTIISALNYLIEEGYPAVNIVTDEFALTDYLPFTDKTNLVIFYGQQKIYAVHPGFSKWKAADEIIELLSTPNDLEVIGLETIRTGMFKTVADGLFSLQFTNPILFIAERL